MKKLFSIFILIFVFLLFIFFSYTNRKENNHINQYANQIEINDVQKITSDIDTRAMLIETKKYIEVNKNEVTIEKRYNTPDGYQRINLPEKSFGHYLRTKKLKSYGQRALYYNGKAKSPKGVYDSVYDYNIGNANLHQAADAIMFLRAEHLFINGMYNSICYSFVNGFQAEYSKWMAGYRIRVNNNEASWHRDTEYICTYDSFLKYMNMIYAYCSTISLKKDLTCIDINEMEVGDILIDNEISDHLAIVVDMAVNPQTGDIVFMLAQGGNPAQQTQIIINPSNPEISPWYELDGEAIVTPECTFATTGLMRLK